LKYKKVLESELRTLIKVGHKNVVKLFGFCLSEDQCILVMNLFKCSLKNIIDDTNENIQKKKELCWYSKEEIEIWCCDILEGLQYLHKSKIAHRDIKPENVLVTFNQSNSVESLHLSDFGTSRFFEGTVIASTIVGTQIYLSPEVANNSKKKYNPFKSDVFSFGVVVHELIAGEAPKKRSNSTDSWRTSSSI